jgi:hypothetical protein
VGKYNRQLQGVFPLEKDKKYYQNKDSNDHKIRSPKKKAFTGNIYLLISAAVAFACSLFASMVAGNQNTIGGYYGYNGHTPMEYNLPKSKIATQFLIVNLEQDVSQRPNQPYNRGLLSNLEVTQSFRDFIKNVDTQMNYTLELLNVELNAVHNSTLFGKTNNHFRQRFD